MKNPLKIVCQNPDRSTLTFAYAFPFWLEEVKGATSSEFDVQTEGYASGDGEYYQGAQAPKRVIEITARCIGSPVQHAALRERLLSFFPPRQTGTLFYYDGPGDAKRIDYKAESVEIDATGWARELNITLVCPDPIWKSVRDEGVSMAWVEGDIEFPVELAKEFTVAHRVPVVMGKIHNDSNVSRGLTITFEASGNVSNPIMIEATRQQRLKVEVDMVIGDILTITTGAHNKHVRLTHEGVTREINSKWVFGSTWLQAEPGKNVFRYTADSGDASLSATITSTPQYWGA